MIALFHCRMSSLQYNVHFYVGATTGGVNPKINNMLQGYKVAKYDLIWINDSALFGKLPERQRTTQIVLRTKLRQL